MESLGATRRQRLLTARIPLARKELLLGLNQTIMMALSMAVIAAVIGAGGLGDRVYQALASVDVGAALAAGIPIVLLAVVLDRVTAAAGDGTTRPRTIGWPYAVAVTVAVALAARLLGALDWPAGWTLGIAEPVNRAVDWMTAHLYSGVPVIGGTADWAGHFTTWVLAPVRDGLLWLPWWSVLLLVAALAWLIGTWRTALTAVLAMAAIGVLGVWEPSLDTLSQVLAAVAVTLVLGFATGVAAARSDRVDRALRPVLDVFQTMPQFVYLIPVVALFGVGRAPAVAAAVVYAPPGRRPDHRPGPAPGRPGRAGVRALARRDRPPAAVAGAAPAGPARAAARRQPGRGPGPRRRHHRWPGRRWRPRLRRRLRSRPGRPGDRPGRRCRHRLPGPDAGPGDAADGPPSEEGSLTCAVRRSRPPSPC